MSYFKGEIYKVYPMVISGERYADKVLIVSNNMYNKYSLTVAVIPIVNNKLILDNQFNIYPKRTLKEKVGAFNSEKMIKLDNTLNKKQISKACNLQ